MEEGRQDPWAPTPGPSASPGAEQGHGTPGPTAQGPHAPAPAAPELVQDEKTWGLAAHLSALAGLLVPLGNIIGPLVVWLAKKDRSPFVDHQGKEALNFQITISLAIFVSGAFMMIGALLALILVGIPLLALGILAVSVFGIIGVVFAIIGAIKANDGIWYRYPMTLRFIQ